MLTTLLEKGETMRVVVTGGGTGGHVTPLKPVVESLKEKCAGDQEGFFSIYIGQRGDRFAGLINKIDDVDEVRLIFAGKYRRYPNESKIRRLFDIKTHILNFFDLFKIAVAVIQSLAILHKFKPDVVFGNGGYVSVPVGLAASILRIPLVIHESDSKFGIANRILASKSNRILFGMPVEFKSLYGRPVEYVGIPLRSGFTADDSRNKSEIRAAMELDRDVPVITISGGSLGAEGINKVLIAELANLAAKYQIIHIAGDGNVKSIERQISKLDLPNDRYKLIGFTDKIDEYFKASDLVITRASATTICELAALSVATILIPAKQLSDQQHNASLINQRQAAEILSELDIERDSSLFSSKIEMLIGDHDYMQTLSENLSQLAMPMAASRIADILIDIDKSHRSSGK